MNAPQVRSAADTSWMARIDALWAGKDVTTIGDAVATDGRRTYGLALILTAIPGFVPGLSSAVGPLLGAAFVALGAQMMAGRHLPWLPGWLQRIRIDRARARPPLARLDRLLARWTERIRWMDRPVPLPLVGAAVIWCGLILGSPLGLVPMSNSGPAMALSLLGMSLLEENPSLAWAGLIVSVIYSLFLFVALTLYWNLLVEPVWAMAVALLR